ACLPNSRLSVHCQIGRDFKTDISIIASGRFVHVPQHIRGSSDILNGEMLVESHDSQVTMPHHLLERGIVILAFADCLLKNGRIRSDPGQTILIDELLQPIFIDKASRQKIEPDGLSLISQTLEWIPVGYLSLGLHTSHLGSLFACAKAICCFATATTFSGVKPNFFSRSFNGAEEPNVCMPILAPLSPTYRSQPITEPISTDKRALRSGGSTWSR